ncbi:hypothetical protein L9F63_020407, partial [Diploptera punctata]
RSFTLILQALDHDNYTTPVAYNATPSTQNQIVFGKTCSPTRTRAINRMVMQQGNVFSMTLNKHCFES